MRGSMAWIDPKGRILDFGVTHIQAIIQYPLKFGLSRKEVLSTFETEGEKLGTEGKAREKLIRRVIQRGFVRIRFQKNYVSVTVDRLDKKTKTVLLRWAELVKKTPKVDMYQPVKVYEIRTDRMKEFTLKELVEGEHLFEEDEQVWLQFTTIDKFGINVLRFADYLI